MTIFQRDGAWFYRVQSTNWRTIDKSGVGGKRSTIERLMAKRYPGVEVVIEE